MDVIEKLPEFNSRFSRWNGNERLSGYPFIENVHAPFALLRRALPMLNLALISSAGAFIKGTEPFDLEAKDGDFTVREIPVEVEALDLEYSARGYNPSSVNQDRNCLVPIDRLLGYQDNGVIGKLNEAWFSVSSYLPNAGRVLKEVVPSIVGKLQDYSVQAAILVPATRLCHQTLGIVARGVEMAGIPTIMISVDTEMVDRVRPPRSVYYDGAIGEVSGKPDWPEYQLRILDEALRSMETFDQPGARKLGVKLETMVEAARGER